MNGKIYELVNELANDMEFETIIFGMRELGYNVTTDDDGRITAQKTGVTATFDDNGVTITANDKITELETIIDIMTIYIRRFAQ